MTNSFRVGTNTVPTLRVQRAEYVARVGRERSVLRRMFSDPLENPYQRAILSNISNNSSLVRVFFRYGFFQIIKISRYARNDKEWVGMTRGVCGEGE